jgi:hypothetical protein
MFFIKIALLCSTLQINLDRAHELYVFQVRAAFLVDPTILETIEDESQTTRIPKVCADKVVRPPNLRCRIDAQAHLQCTSTPNR